MSSEDRLTRLGLDKYKDDPKKLKQEIDKRIKEREKHESDWNENRKRDESKDDM